MLDDVEEFLTSPFQPGVSIVDIFAFTGLTLVSLFLWRIIFNHIAEA
jgi:hypothetical protein